MTLPNYGLAQTACLNESVPFSAPSKQKLLVVEVSDFIRVSLGLPRCPLDRLQEAVELLKIEGKKLPTLKERKFATKYIKYLERTWTSEKCRFKPESWNFFKYKGPASTNNHNEE